ncbi:thiamine pyrophosphate-binding protein [Actinomadura welshii]|uniref:thiamine pyrophosphate-binding protein n=1 Tax=Actinomadura welshii TaxID=3103817 RepID=UPI0003AD2A50|nr:thiamine pyrophosphate-binding protein [Actinomadura madurae]
MKAYQALAAELVEQGVHTAFGLMGDANMQFVAHYSGALGRRFVGATHEAGGVAAADGYFRMTGEVAFASVTHGPGITNTVTALTEAARNRSEIVVLTGDTPPVRTWTQMIDIGAVVAPTGAGYERVYSAESVVFDLRRALHRARTERRPVVLNLPYALMQGEADAPRNRVPTATRVVDGTLEEETLEGALDLIAGAKRPVILAGRGAAASGAREDLLALAELLGCPVATTLLGRDLFAGHPLNVGICGSLASSVGTEILMQADCLLAFGAGLNRYTTFVGELTQGKRILQVDTDLTNVGLYTPVDHVVHGDAATVARRLTEVLTEAEFEGSGWGRKFSERLTAYRPTDEFEDRSADGCVDVRSAVVRLDKVLPADRNVVTDVGRFIMAAWRFMTVTDPLRFTHTSTFGSIGLGLGTAIGAAVASPERLTVAIMGDGGFMMTAGELSTAVRHKVPLLVIVLNDGAYGAEYTKLKNHGDDPDFSLVEWPDIAEVGSAMGAQVLKVTRVDELDQVGKLARDLRGPLLVDVRLDPRLDVGHW